MLIPIHKHAKVLGFPEVNRRIGDDAQQIPWQTSWIKTGLAQIDARLNRVVDKGEQASS